MSRLPCPDKVSCPTCGKRVKRIGLPTHFKAVHGARMPTPPKERVMCPYCAERAQLLTGADIYPHRPDLSDKKFWACKSCNAYVGCIEGTFLPLGRLANAELRIWKRRAHDAFDPLWKDGGFSRTGAYAHLAELLEIPGTQAHIGLFDVAQCQRVVEIFSQERKAE